MLHSHLGKERFLFMNKLLQTSHAQKDDYTTIAICNQQRTVSKNWSNHFMPSQRVCKAILFHSTLSVQPGVGPGLCSDQAVNA